jgi:hypothetical protein
MRESIAELFPDASEAVREIIGRLRALVRAAAPEATEIFYHGALGYGPTTSGFDRIIYIVPQNGYANLGFFYGGHLNDPLHLLGGSGKRMRHVTIKTLQAADHPDLQRLVRDAWTDGIASVAALHASSRKK